MLDGGGHARFAIVGFPYECVFVAEEPLVRLHKMGRECGFAIVINEIFGSGNVIWNLFLEVMLVKENGQYSRLRNTTALQPTSDL